MEQAVEALTTPCGTGRRGAPRARLRDGGRRDRHRRRPGARRGHLHLRAAGLQLHRVPRRHARDHGTITLSDPTPDARRPRRHRDADRLHVPLHQPQRQPHLLRGPERHADAHRQCAGRIAQQRHHGRAERAGAGGRHRGSQPAAQLHAGGGRAARLRRAAAERHVRPRAGRSPGAGRDQPDLHRHDGGAAGVGCLVHDGPEDRLGRDPRDAGRTGATSGRCGAGAGRIRRGASCR